VVAGLGRIGPATAPAIDLLKAKHAGKRVTEKTVESVAGFLWGMKIARAA